MSDFKCDILSVSGCFGIDVSLCIVIIVCMHYCVCVSALALLLTLANESMSMPHILSHFHKMFAHNDFGIVEKSCTHIHMVVCVCVNLTAVFEKSSYLFFFAGQKQFLMNSLMFLLHTGYNLFILLFYFIFYTSHKSVSDQYPIQYPI